MKVILFLIFIGLWWSVCRAVTAKRPWGKLSQDFKTNQYVTFSESASAQTSVVLIQKNVNKFVAALPLVTKLEDDVYILARKEGVLFCGSWFGHIFRLNRNFLIPWQHLHIREEAIGSPLYNLNGSRYIASVETTQGHFEFNLDEKIVLEGQAAGLITSPASPS